MKKSGYIFITIIGLILMLCGGYIVKNGGYSEGLEIVAYLSIGLGTGIFGSGIGGYIKEAAVSKDPEFAKKQRIEENDERNVSIVNEAKSKAFTLMNFLYGAMFLAFSIMKADIKYILIMVGIYLIVNIYAVVVANKLRREM